jgi:putative flippase GtrA
MPATPKKRPVVFLSVGIANTLIDFGFYTLLTLTVLSGESRIALAGVISGTFALLCAFLTHSLITWRGSPVGMKTVGRFVVFTGFGMWAIRPLLLSLFIKLSAFYVWTYGISRALHLPFSHQFVANTGAFGLMAVIVLVYNYFVYDRFVFNKNHAHQNEGNSDSV